MNGKRNNAPAEEVARLYGLGLTMAEIAGVFGVSAWVIASRLDRAGVARRRASADRTMLPVEQAVHRYRRQPRRLAELAADLGINVQIIVDRSRQADRREQGRRRRDRADVPADEVAGLYQAGWTVAQIAARYRTAASTVLRRLDDAGVARRPRSVPVPFPVDEAARRVLQDGVSFAQLARNYHVGVDSVRGQLAARGIQAPPQNGARVLRDVSVAEIAALYASGLTVARIAMQYGVSPATISARLRAAGVTPRRAAPPQTTKPVPVQEAARRYRQGAILTELADAYGVTVPTMRRKLTAAGVPRRSRGPGRIPIPVEEAARLYTAGQTMRQLADRYGVCETVIYNRLTEAGTPLRRKTDRKQVDAALLARLAEQVGFGMAQ